MLLTEYDEAKTMELFKEEGRQEGRMEGRMEGRQEGRVEGRAEGEARLSALITKLISLGRIDDIAKATSDPSYRDRLYAEFSMA